MRYSSIFFLLFYFSIGVSSPKDSTQKYFSDGFLDSLEQRTFYFFWDVTDASTGLTPDRFPSLTFSSTAAIGFALTSYGIGSERNYVTRKMAADRTLATLKYLYDRPQSDASTGVSGYKGFFYHFLDFKTGSRFNTDIELSTIDTALLLAGVLFCQSYFDLNTPVEKAIRTYCDSLYLRVDWKWTQTSSSLLSMGWFPDRGMHHAEWKGYDESMILYILALGSPTHPINHEAWDKYTSHFKWMSYFGYHFISFGPLFGHQYSQAWIDFRGIQDAYMKDKGIDYFINSRLATLSQRTYAIKNPEKMRGYAENMWGFSACDGPADDTRTIDGVKRRFQTYSARGVSADWVNDDGTITPTGAGGSIAFAPEICVPALKTMRDTIPGLWTSYGFLDAFNLTYVTDTTENGWVDRDYLGIDQGPIVIMIENLRSELVWETMKKNPYIVSGLRKAGFKGGWLDVLQMKK
jgi:hypothetical protein